MVNHHSWVNQAIRAIKADQQRSADTHLIKLNISSLTGIDIYLKDESSHPTGSLKHRLARSLFLFGLCSGKIHKGMPIIEASSGSTAISEAYFARLLNVPFIAVVPTATARKKIEQIEFYGGQCHLTDNPSDMYQKSEQLAKDLNGYYMNQFTFAERATDWRGNNNIANTMFRQMENEPYPEPSWVVMSAGTGGTSATIGRFIRYRQLNTRLCVVDPENSVFHDYFKTGDDSLTLESSSLIEGIGRPRVEPSFIPSVVDTMMTIPDPASIATTYWLNKSIGRKVGASTGTNLFGVLTIASGMQERGEQGSIVTLLCDAGDRYMDTYYNPEWVAANIGDISVWEQALEALNITGRFSLN